MNRPDPSGLLVGVLAAALLAAAQHRPLQPFRGEVLRADTVSLTVRDRQDPRRIRTFHYAPALRTKILHLFEPEGIEPGSHVEVRYDPASPDIAVAVHIHPPRHAHNGHP
jgi:hypothetical protein